MKTVPRRDSFAALADERDADTVCPVCGKPAARYEPGVGWMHFTKIGSIWHKEKPGLRSQAGSDALFYGAPRGDPKGLQNA